MQLLRFFFIVSLALCISARRTPSFRSRYHRIQRNNNNSTRSFTLQDLYREQDFLDEFNFFSGEDPTHGSVNYLTKSEAQAKKLAYVQEDGTTVLAVDDYTDLKEGEFRNSVRISSKKKYNGGLFIADFWAMPHGCSTWPAYWTVGDDWPNHGEVDIIEGVNEGKVNQYTLHTSEGCSASTSTKISGHLLGTTCAFKNGDNSGCGFIDTDTKSYGEAFNRQAGGVFAHLWDSEGIKVWRFSRKAVPEDIESRNPKPETWGPPVAQWSKRTCNIEEHFIDHSIVINTTMCGDLAGAVFPGEGCSGTCSQAVADKNNFKFAKWMINYVAVYQSA